MPDRAYLCPIDPELIPGARNAINVCLRLKPQERITIITDTATREIAAALQTEVEGVGSDYSLFVLEHHARRPLKFMPEIVLDDLARSQVSIFAAQTQPDELPARTQMTSVVNKHRIRHGHMVNINRQIMLEGMRADFVKVDDLSERLVERARKAERIICKTPHGTEFEAELSPKLRWLKTSGIITRDKWGNLPGGEIFTAPMNTNGVFVVDGVVGDYLCERFGDLESARWSRRTRICATNFAPTPARTRTATALGNSPSEPTRRARMLLATFYRTKKSRVSTSLLAIPTPSTPAQTGFPRRISTASAVISTSGSMANK